MAKKSLRSRARVRAFIRAFREGRIVFFTHGDGMVSWRWANERN